MYDKIGRLSGHGRDERSVQYIIHVTCGKWKTIKNLFYNIILLYRIRREAGNRQTRYPASAPKQKQSRIQYIIIIILYRTEIELIIPLGQAETTTRD